VIARWSRKRAEEFFDEFCAQISIATAERTSQALEYALDRIIADEICSEVLFDAYRRVTLARSKLLGPRIIAILTAELVLATRLANDAEDAMFAAAEGLTDDELLAFAHFVRAEQQRNPPDPESGSLKIVWNKERIDSYFAQISNVPTGPLDLNSALGRWAAKLWAYGIVRHDVLETHQQYYADPTRDRLTDRSVREIEWLVEVPHQYFKLVELIERASLRPERQEEPRY
jgi:hypothetical protein